MKKNIEYQTWVKQLTDEVRLSRLQQQAYNDKNKALGATHSQ